MLLSGNNSSEDEYPEANTLQNVTGKALHEWLAMMDTWDGDKRKLHALTEYLKCYHHLDDEWAQVIALNYLWKRL